MPVKTPPKYPGWRTTTAAQRHNARAERIWEQARILGAATRFNEDSRHDTDEAVERGSEPPKHAH